MDRREAMIADIERDARETATWTGRQSLRPAVLGAMRDVPRASFVPVARAADAWANRPLAIGHGQTVSQPFIVALMTDLLELEPAHRVLEIGTGSGYQTAVLAQLAAEVFSVEIIPALADGARRTLAALGLQHVHLHCGDGARGWPERAPFDAVIVTAAAPAIPPALIEQLRPGGRLVAPVGRAHADQSLILLTKDTGGGVSRRDLLPVAFVPLTGPQDFPPEAGPA